MLKVACLPSHPFEKLVPRKKRRGSKVVYKAVLALIQKVTKPLLKFLIVPVHMHELHTNFNF